MNPAILSPYASQNWDALNGAQYALLQAQLAKAGEDPDKYAFLAPNLCGADRRFKVQEKRKAEWVEFLNIAYAAGVDPATLPDLEGCETLIYADINLVGNSNTVTATAVVNPSGVNNSMTYTAVTPTYAGALGNGISITYVDTGVNPTTLLVSVSGKDITVRLARTAAITSTAAQVKAAYDALPAAVALATVANSGLDTGAGIVTAMPKTYLSGGHDAYIP